MLTAILLEFRIFHDFPISCNILLSVTSMEMPFWLAANRSPSLAYVEKEHWATNGTGVYCATIWKLPIPILPNQRICEDELSTSNATCVWKNCMTIAALCLLSQLSNVFDDALYRSGWHVNHGRHPQTMNLLSWTYLWAHTKQWICFHEHTSEISEWTHNY